MKPPIKPPGWKLPPGLKAQVDAARSVQGIICAEELEKSKDKKPKRRRAVEHFGLWRDSKGYLRHPNGRFAQDRVPKHKRVY